MSSTPRSNPSLPKISFGIIVLNGEPFTRYCLRALYPYAYQILVVEGGSRHAAPFCTPDGHSTDATLATLRRFCEEEDPEKKVEIITRDGFWEEKDEQSQAFAERVRGEWLWQVDIDEFYMPQGMESICQLLSSPNPPDAVSFETLTFWGALDCRVDGMALRAGFSEYHRLFRFGPGYRYVKHRPPTVVDPHGRDLRSLRWIRGAELAQRGVFLYHYSLLFPHQVEAKCVYYDALTEGRRSDRAWFEEVYLHLRRPFHVHNLHRHPSWLERYPGEHPPEVHRMIEDVLAGQLPVGPRSMADVRALFESPFYALGRAALKAIAPLYTAILRWWWWQRPDWLRRSLSLPRAPRA